MKENKELKLYKFETVTCGACKMLGQAMAQADIPPVVSIDCEEHPELAAQYQVFQVPTLILVDENDVVIKRHTGFMAKEQLEKWVINHG